jgi:hypothetical protein
VSETLAGHALCTLAELHRQCNIPTSDTAKDDLMIALINGLTMRAERLLGFHVGSATYLERYTLTPQIGNAITVLLNNRPVTSIDFVRWGKGPALGVMYSGAGIEATVACTTTGIRLRSVAADGTETITETGLTFSSCKSINALSTAISMVSGWNAVTRSNCPSAHLSPVAGINALNTYAEITRPDTDLEYTFDTATGTIGKPLQMEWPEMTTPGIGNMGRGLASPGFAGVLIQYTAGLSAIPADIKTAFLAGCQAVYMAAGRSRPMTDGGKNQGGPWKITEQGDLLALFDLQFALNRRIAVG